MQHHRRTFIRNGFMVTGALLATKHLAAIAAAPGRQPSAGHLANSVSVFHTSDLHNQIDAFQEGVLRGLGGLRNVHNLLKNNNTSLLVDAGDFLDESASHAKHREMIDLMNRTGYKVATPGNRELANGQAYLADLALLMNFQMVNCNYDFSHLRLRKAVLPYKVIRLGGLTVGITGVGADLDSRLRQAENIGWQHPYKSANDVSSYLKQEKHCDMVICLSHLGYKNEDGSADNKCFAAASDHIDLIISGHKNTFQPAACIISNKKNYDVVVSHGGGAGLVARRIDFQFNRERKRAGLQCSNFMPGLEAAVSFHEGFKRLKA